MSIEMPDEWRAMSFSEAVAINPKRVLPKDGFVPFLDMANLPLHGADVSVAANREVGSGGSKFQSGDTLFARITPCAENGKLGFVRSIADGEVAQGSTEFIVMAGRGGLTLPEYVRYLASWSEVRDQAIGLMEGTSGRQRVPNWAFDEIEVPIPPLDEQRRMAEVLRSVDEAASLAQRTAEQQLTLWEALADDLIWLPALENSTFLAPLGRFIKASDYGVNAPLYEQPNGIAVLRMGNIQQGQIDLANLKWGKIGEIESAALKLRDGDILFNRTNSRDLVGKVALVRGEQGYLYASYLVRLSIDRSVADPYFVFAAMNSRRGQSGIRTIATPGVSQSNINPTNLKKLLFPSFGLERQRKIAILLQDVETAWLAARREVERLRALRVTVGSQLLSGRVRVPA